MLNFVRINFRRLFSLILWVILIAYALIGLIGGIMLGDGGAEAALGGLGGLLLGTIFGTVSVIILGGLISIIMNIDDNIKKLADKA